MEPLVKNLGPLPDVIGAFERLAQLPYCLFLDSALKHDQLGRYSYLTADPFEFLELDANVDQDPFEVLKSRLSLFETVTVADLPPFQGGAAGLFSYDLKHALERVPASRFDEFRLPAMAIGLYDVVLAIDHQQADNAWLISCENLLLCADL